MQIMQINPYLNFDGNCREAFEYYQQVLGGDLDLVTHADMPMEGLDEAWKDKILHARLDVGGQVLMASDLPPDVHTTTQGFSVSIQVNSASDAERIFKAFSEGGSVQMELAETPWAHRFGMMTDRYGTPWMVNCEKAE